jgi:hypothetical protein
LAIKPIKGAPKMNKIYKNIASFLGFTSSTPTPSAKRRGRPVGSGKTSTPKTFKYVQQPSGQLVRLGKGRPAKGITVVLKTEAEAAAHNALIAA